MNTTKFEIQDICPMVIVPYYYSKSNDFFFFFLGVLM